MAPFSSSNIIHSFSRSLEIKLIWKDKVIYILDPAGEHVQTEDFSLKNNLNHIFVDKRGILQTLLLQQSQFMYISYLADCCDAVSLWSSRKFFVDDETSPDFTSAWRRRDDDWTFIFWGESVSWRHQRTLRSSSDDSHVKSLICKVSYFILTTSSWGSVDRTSCRVQLSESQLLETVFPSYSSLCQQ